MAYNDYYSNMDYYSKNCNRYMNSMPYQMPVSKSKCECPEGEIEPVDEMAIAMCYVPWQQWENVYELEKGYRCGTIFPSLNKPYRGRKR